LLPKAFILVDVDTILGAYSGVCRHLSSQNVEIIPFKTLSSIFQGYNMSTRFRNHVTIGSRIAQSTQILQ
jgi:hypothetical protein